MSIMYYENILHLLVHNAFSDFNFTYGKEMYLSVELHLDENNVLMIVNLT
jgi:hypothetical protein